MTINIEMAVCLGVALIWLQHITTAQCTHIKYTHVYVGERWAAFAASIRSPLISRVHSRIKRKHIFYYFRILRHGTRLSIHDLWLCSFNLAPRRCELINSASIAMHTACMNVCTLGWMRSFWWHRIDGERLRHTVHAHTHASSRKN